MVNVFLIGVIAVVIVLLILGALDRWNVFGDDRENEESGTDRVKQEARREGDFEVSLLKKHKTLTMPAKVIAVALGLLFLATGVFAYFSLRNGAPVEVPYAGAMEAGALAIVGIGGGVAYRAKKDGQRGQVEVVYEDIEGSEEASETIWFAPAESDTNKDGNLIVYEHFPTRILGLFGRRKLVAHDRELRAERGILSDIVAHEIPSHAVQLDDHHYLIRTQERTVTSGVSNAADYRYRTPIELPYKTHLKQREQMEKLRSRLETKDAILGETQTQVAELQRRLETQDIQTEEEAMEFIVDIMETLQAGDTHVEYRTDRRPGRQPKDQRDLAENGAEVDS
jgi:hypothetical protein